jgi:hypothetical protein
MRRLGLPLALVALVALVGLVVFGWSRIGGFLRGPDPESIATASLESMREQARLVPFVARYVTVVTSSQRRLGLTAQKTLILPGTVRYELDLAQLGDDDVAWDAGTRTLSVTLPPLEIAGPEIDMDGVQEYSGGGILLRLTNAGDVLDESNRRAGREELLRQARAPVPMRLARDAAKRAVARSFALPLRAAGVEANVEVRFAGEAGASEPSYLDRSRRIEDVLEERRQAAP